MRGLELYSEPFAKTGNMAAEGFKRLLGRPTLGLLQTLIREGIQNVLDASHGAEGPKVLIRLRTLTAEQRKALSEGVLVERPRGDSTRADIDAALSKSDLRVLELCDFGTEGLSGPTRADAPHDGEEPLNFVNFLRNVGAARDTHHGGGTYGYGKSSLYAISSCSTIVVDSQTRCANHAERRLMACHLGAAFDATGSDGERRRYTGRHWWGIRDGVDSVDPATDERAAALSEELGMFPRGRAQTGTSILIIDPLLGDDASQSAIEDIVETVLWNFWPRMVSSTPQARRLTVEVELEGESVPVPSPEEFPPLDLFASAMSEHRAKGADLQSIVCGNARKQLGNLVRKNGLRAERRWPATREGSLIPKQASHIALMRPVELVVKYIEGDPLPDRRFDWAGVFICSDSDEIEEAFALAEPPAHDDWIPDNLPKGNAKTFVRVALRRLNEIARPPSSHALPATASVEAGPSLAATAARMGAFLDAVSATGPGRPPRKPGAVLPRKSLAVSAPKFEGLQLDAAGRPLAKFSAELHNDGSDANLHLIVAPYLVVDGGSTDAADLPEGFELNVSQILLGGLRKAVEGPWIKVGRDGGTVEMLVPTVKEAAVGVRLQLKSGRPE
ncbi:hypothetical protein [Lysobacter niastensis]|uniref:ATP-binding protein n=1 Tax=Lysobacter niastensis TaxID=380629 RepID=A0ABS0B8K2_9GAMM|nr:hypothetical protein [Lysobacter niastensis]MBF6025346.1 hypothetical protein [Lysobacter niastensis]